MNTKELIEKRIEEVAGYLRASARSRQGGDMNSSVLFLEEACDKLLLLAQNQQAQIEELQRERAGWDSAKDWPRRAR